MGFPAPVKTNQHITIQQTCEQRNILSEENKTVWQPSLRATRFIIPLYMQQDKLRTQSLILRIRALNKPLTLYMSNSNSNKKKKQPCQKCFYARGIPMTAVSEDRNKDRPLCSAKTDKRHTVAKMLTQICNTYTWSPLQPKSLISNWVIDWKPQSHSNNKSKSGNTRIHWSLPYVTCYFTGLGNLDWHFYLVKMH